MKKIELHGKHSNGKFALVDDDDYQFLNQFRWVVNNHGYAICYVCEPEYQDERFLMHAVVVGAEEGYVVDHINQDRLDNRKSNLRHVGRAVNYLNSPLFKSNTTGYRGVRKEKYGKWIAMIGFNHQRIYLGSFTTPEEAAVAYDNAVTRYYGEGVRLNFPALQT